MFQNNVQQIFSIFFNLCSEDSGVVSFDKASTGGYFSIDC